MGDCVSCASHKRSRVVDEGMYQNDVLEHIKRSRMSQLPHRHIGSIICRHQKDQPYPRNVGSGILISRNLVLTCFHILFDHQLGKGYKFI
jgi:hypothetical protein